MERKIKSKLLRWKERGNRTALMIEGARQVGKTYIVNEFGNECYHHFLRIDCKDETFDDGFWGGEAKDIIRRITLRYTSFRADGRDALLFLDEIQDCPEAMSALKTLAESGIVDVVCCGSFPGLHERSPKGYPVGCVHKEEMHPMDFEEYLWAVGVSHEHTEDIRRHVRNREPFDPSILRTLEEYYRQYLIVGGMPLPVLRSVTSCNAGDFMEAQDDILDGYRRDIASYAGGEKDNVLRLLEIVPMELGKPNKRLVFRDIDHRRNTGIREYRKPVQWIEGSRFVSICRRLRAIDRPLKRDAIDSMLKMYMVDTGLLVRMFGRGTAEAMLRGDLSVNEGAIGENSVCQMLRACGIEPYYYEVDKEVEVDFIAEIGADLCAIEVKTGKKRRARSLKKLMELDAGNRVDRWMKFEYGNILFSDDGVEHYPLFCASFADLMVPEMDIVLKKADPSKGI